MSTRCSFRVRESPSATPSVRGHAGDRGILRKALTLDEEQGLKTASAKVDLKAVGLVAGVVRDRTGTDVFEEAAVGNVVGPGLNGQALFDFAELASLRSSISSGMGRIWVRRASSGRPWPSGALRTGAESHSLDSQPIAPPLPSSPSHRCGARSCSEPRQAGVACDRGGRAAMDRHPDGTRRRGWLGGPCRPSRIAE